MQEEEAARALEGSKPAVTNGHDAQAGATPRGCGKELVALSASARLPALLRNSSITLDLGCCCQHTTLL